MAEELYFTADAALIDRIGRELVGKQETGLLELVKNSYDADATAVKVTFEQDNLTIEDNGTGMNRQELISGFLRLAGDMKIRKPVSERFERRRAGRKGIGRFATQRLGRHLVLSTWKEPNVTGLELTVDWHDFQQGLELDHIPLTLEDIEPHRPGTTIKITGPRDSWSDAQIRRCWRGVLNLQQPFPVAPVAQRPCQDPGFEVSFFRADQDVFEPELIANVETELLNHMHTVVEFRVDTNGRAEWRMTRNRFGTDYDWSPINHEDPEARRPPPYIHINNAWMKAYYAILEPTEFSPMIFARVRDLLRTEGGVRLYRNGFRVIPFGDPDDDWLRLDEAYGKRAFLFPIANRNWFGIIEIHDPDGEKFDEPTSREGLIETPAFDELRGLASSVLITAAQRVAEQRNRKTRAGGSNKEPTDHYLRRIRDAARKAREVDASDARAGDSRGTSTATEAAQLLDEAEDIIEDVKAHYADEASILRLLATVGLAVAEFSHETGMTFQAVRLDFEKIFTVLLDAHSDDSEFTNLVERARSMVERLDALTSYLNELASARSVRELAPVSVSRSVEEFDRGMSQLALRSEVELLVRTPPLDGLYTTPIHQAEVASILLNFYTNSIKAMKRSKGIRRILVEARRDDDDIVLLFSDTGDGILKENRDRIFDLFFTTRAATASGSSAGDENTGTGLGLWIVHQIVSRANGAIQVVDPPSGYSTTLEVRLPMNEEEL